MPQGRLPPETWLHGLRLRTPLTSKPVSCAESNLHKLALACKGFCATVSWLMSFPSAKRIQLRTRLTDDFGNSIKHGHGLGSDDCHHDYRTVFHATSISAMIRYESGRPRSSEQNHVTTTSQTQHGHRTTAGQTSFAATSFIFDHPFDLCQTLFATSSSKCFFWTLRLDNLFSFPCAPRATRKAQPRSESNNPFSQVCLCLSF